MMDLKPFILFAFENTPIQRVDFCLRQGWRVCGKRRSSFPPRTRRKTAGIAIYFKVLQQRPAQQRYVPGRCIFERKKYITGLPVTGHAINGIRSRSISGKIARISSVALGKVATKKSLSLAEKLIAWPGLADSRQTVSIQLYLVANNRIILGQTGGHSTSVNPV